MTQTKLKEFFDLLDEIAVFNRCIGKVDFDKSCCAPDEGLQKAAEDEAFLGKYVFELSHSEKYCSLLTYLYEHRDELSFTQKRAIEMLYNDYAKTKNFSPEFDYEMSMVFAKAYGDWLEAKKTADYSIFKDVFAKEIEYTRKAIDLRDRKYSTYYNACLDDYEEGGNEQQLDAFFAAIKERAVPLLRRIVAEGKPIREDFMSRPVAIPLQEQCSKYLLELEGLRKSALVLMTTEHPFTTNFGSHDVRVTTHYHEDSFISNIFTTLHEGGHALFMQNEPAQFELDHCGNRMSSAMHETISRFYENIVGRSEEFVNYIYPQLLSLCGGIFDDISARELYEAVNVAKPSLIRTESDELTYCLHIMIRYELEKAFVNGEIGVEEIPALWNAKYKEYLGVDVPNDTVGVLQDVHWTFSFGYFPSYALGNAYGAQILNTMLKDFDFYGEVAKGNLTVVLDWLKEHVFSIASVSTPDEWIKAITGESLNVNYYLDYLEKKYTKLYEL